MSSFGVELNMCRLLLSFVYTCMSVGEPVIKREVLGSHQPVKPRHIVVPVPNQNLDS